MLDYSLRELYQLPAMHYVRMGLIGNGGYDATSHAVAQSLPDASARTAQAMEEIRQRLSDYGIIGFLEHMKAKLLYTWNDGLYFATQKISIDPIAISDIHLIVLEDGKYFPVYQAYAQSCHLAMLPMICFSCVKAVFTSISKTPGLLHVLQITILGVAIFLIIWETRSRYLVNMLPLFALCEAWSIGELANCFGIKMQKTPAG